jgi:hypothetical protein
MEKISLEEVIRSYIHLGRPNPGGWHPVLCKVCHDHGKRGERAAFKFDGETVGYHCFNCGHSTVYNPDEHRSIPHKMLKVFQAFGIPDTAWQPVVFQNLARIRPQNSNNQPQQYVSIEPSRIELPSYFIQLGVGTSMSNEVAEYAKEYLKDDRGIDWQSYPFYIAKDVPQAKRWFGRLVIPIYKDNKLIYYQGRDLSGLAQRKYLSPVVDRERVLYGYENLHTNIDEPLYVVESFFDAFLLNGVAVFGNKLYEPQIKWLNQSRRQKVIIPDRYGDGHLLAKQAIDLGWAVATPDAPGCKDITDVVKKYGMLYTLKTIHDNTHEGFAALTNVALYCRRD